MTSVRLLWPAEGVCMGSTSGWCHDRCRPLTAFPNSCVQEDEIWNCCLIFSKKECGGTESPGTIFMTVEKSWIVLPGKRSSKLFLRMSRIGRHDEKRWRLTKEIHFDVGLSHHKQFTSLTCYWHLTLLNERTRQYLIPEWTVSWMSLDRSSFCLICPDKNKLSYEVNTSWCSPSRYICSIHFHRKHRILFSTYSHCTKQVNSNSAVYTLFYIIKTLHFTSKLCYLLLDLANLCTKFHQTVW